MKYNAVLETVFSSEGSTEPVTLAEIKEWIKVDVTITEDDTLLTALGISARKVVEGYLCVSLIPRTVVAIFNNSGGDIELPYGPVNTFTSLYETATTLDDTEITSDNYLLKGGVFKTLNKPCSDYLKATYTAGYANAAAVPEHFKTGIKQQVAFMYENRGDNPAGSQRVNNQTVPTQLSPMAKITLQPYRRVW